MGLDSQAVTFLMRIGPIVHILIQCITMQSPPLSPSIFYSQNSALSLSHSLNSNCGFPQFRRLAATRGNYAFMSEWGRADIDFCHSSALSTLSRGIVIHIQWLLDLLVHSRWRSCSTTTICKPLLWLQMVVVEQLRHLLYTSSSRNHCAGRYT